MSDVTIRMRPNGPLVIEGPFKLVDSRGAEFEIPPNKPAVALCRRSDGSGGRYLAPTAFYGESASSGAV